MSRRALAWVLCGGLFLLARPARAQGPDLNEELEKAMKAAVAKVAPSVVQIITQGGSDVVVTGPKGPAFRKGLGPTTGLIVSTDGYVVSSAFNFVNNPTTILVAVPGRAEPLVAKKIATDRARMITLLKVEANGLPVPTASPNLHVGQWAIALGRTLDLKRTSAPSVSVGIISALDRIWGRAVQTDAKVSPLNYGGPLIDIQGRVQGVLVPASPQGEGETVGFEWYDSGIGFAIPLTDINAVLPRLKQGKDLHKGLLGIRLKSPDLYSAVPEIASVIKDSAGERAGLKAGDVLIEMEGKPVVRMAQVLHLLGPKYEGDKISLKFRRGKDTITVNNLELVSTVKELAHPYLGILPLRDDPRLGVEIRHVFAKGPAEKAGLKPGDRIVKVGTGMAPLRQFSGTKSGRDEFFDFLNQLTPGTEIKLEVVRKDAKDAKDAKDPKKPETITLTLAELPGTVQDDSVPAKLTGPASYKRALAPLETSNPKIKPPKIDAKEKPVTGLIKRNTAGGNKYWIYAPDDYDPNISYALVVWLHPPGKHQDDDVEKFTDMWEDYCKDNHIIMVGPLSDKESGWVASDAEFVLEAVRDALNRYTIDRQRIVAHGLGLGGQMAIYMGFHARDLFRGIVTSGAVVTQIKDNQANRRLAFYLSGGDRDPLIKSIAESKTKLAQRKFPVIFRDIPNRGREYFEEAVLAEVVRWIDCLDRQ
jgi:S1-C subfamily serine protease/predicted esterase